MSEPVNDKTPVNDQPLDRADPDVLISRIVDNEATPADWAVFHALAEHDSDLWRDLAEAQRTQTELGEEVGVAIAASGLVDVPMHTEIERRFSNRIRMIGIWGGWAAAACIGVMWMNGANAPQQTPGAGNAASLVDPLRTYLDRGQADGRVIQEMPEKVLVGVSPVTDANGNDIGSGYEVVYLRQILERAVVKDLYRFGQDEGGRYAPVRFDVPARAGKPM